MKVRAEAPVLWLPQLAAGTAVRPVAAQLPQGTGSCAAERLPIPGY
jgi:hypothetical protein